MIYLLLLATLAACMSQGLSTYAHGPADRRITVADELKLKTYVTPVMVLLVSETGTYTIIVYSQGAYNDTRMPHQQHLDTRLCMHLHILTKSSLLDLCYCQLEHDLWSQKEKSVDGQGLQSCIPHGKVTGFQGLAL